MSYLFERNDFPELVSTTATDLGISNPDIVEKDYFVTEALRSITAKHGSKIIFKGGTSLSKGWNLIQRFSEDIDLYIHPDDKGIKARNTLLKEVVSSAANHPAFIDGPQKIDAIDGRARSARLPYPSQNQSQTIQSSVLIELGIQSGTFPTETRPIQSMLAEKLIQAGIVTEQEDGRPFNVSLLHFRRTFVEKMFAIHDKVARSLLQEGRGLGGYARHYYDLSQLIQTNEVREMLASPEYVQIVEDYHRVTSKFYPRQVFPARLELGHSPALFPDKEILPSLKGTYDEQCNILCYSSYPSFEEVLGMFEEIRPFLIAMQ